MFYVLGDERGRLDESRCRRDRIERWFDSRAGLSSAIAVRGVLLDEDASCDNDGGGR